MASGDTDAAVLRGLSRLCPDRGSVSPLRVILGEDFDARGRVSPLCLMTGDGESAVRGLSALCGVCGEVDPASGDIGCALLDENVLFRDTLLPYSLSLGS